MENILVEKKRFGISTIQENRMPIFLGLNRNSVKKTTLYKQFVENERQIYIRKNDYVMVIKNELLTQTHKDVLESLLVLRNMKIREEAEGEPRKQKFNFYDVFRVLEKKTPNNTWLEEIIEELTNVKLHIAYDNEPNYKIIGIISNLDYDRNKKDAVITWDDGFLAMYDKASILNYPKFIPQIANLEHDVTKQVVRWLLTFSNLNISLEDLLTKKLSLDRIVKPRAIYRYIQKIKEEELVGFGISINDAKNPIISIARDNSINFFDGLKINDINEIKKKKKQKPKLPLLEM